MIALVITTTLVGAEASKIDKRQFKSESQCMKALKRSLKVKQCIALRQQKRITITDKVGNHVVFELVDITNDLRPEKVINEAERIAKDACTLEGKSPFIQDPIGTGGSDLSGGTPGPGSTLDGICVDPNVELQ